MTASGIFLPFAQGSRKVGNCQNQPESSHSAHHQSLPPASTTLADLEWNFAHAGVFLDYGSVLCPAGRASRNLWAVRFARVETDFTTSITDPGQMRSFVAEPTADNLRIVPAVAKLIAILADPRFA